MSAKLAALLVGAAMMLLALPSIASAAVDTIIFEDLFDLYQQDLNGANREFQLTDSDQDDFALGPAGEKVVYSTSDQQIAVYMGGSVYTLFAGDWNTRDFVARPHFAPDDQSVIFARSAANDPRIWDLWSVNLDGSNLRRVLSWNGNQDHPVYSPNGQKIAFTSNTDVNGSSLKTPYVFVANANGTGAVKIVAGSEPTFSPDGTRLAYTSGGNIYAINASDGRSKVQVTRNGQSGDPDWSPDGTTIAYRKGVPLSDGRIFYEIWFVNPNGTSDRQYVAEPLRSKFSPSFRQPSTTVGVWDYLASVFYPRVYFDTSEQWRPLQVAEFFREGGHSVDGFPISDWTGLRTFPSSSSTLDVRGEGSEGNYTSPYSWCTDGTGLRDCDTGGLTSGYYHASTLSPASYTYLDYWYFYRYNYFGSAPIANDFNHEADWEGVSIAPSRAAVNAFDFASFSQHGTWYSYLREALSCDDGGQGSCGPNARRVHTHPANGTHANYGTTCSEWVYYACVQSDGITPERGYDGAREWGGNVATRFPANIGWSFPSTANWVDWPGMWGVERNVASPGAAGTGNGNHYNAPWNPKCGPSGCVREAAGDRTRLKPSRTTSVGTSARWCANWFGGDVQAMACTPRRLGKAIDSGALRGSGSLRLSSPDRRVHGGDAPGIAQLTGPALAPGQRIEVAGRTEQGTVVFARAARGQRLTIGRFRLPAGRIRATIEAVAAPDGTAQLRLRLASGRLVEPQAVWTARRPKPRAGGGPRKVVPPRRSQGRAPMVASGRAPHGAPVRRRANTHRPRG
ncbi:MAG TPA: hypothetical protein VF520_13360 [Thermoleophilaceae bacterium]|jgi:hypothetical protein